MNRPEIGGFIKMASALTVLQTVYININSTFIGLDKTEYGTIIPLLQAVAKAMVAPVLVMLGFSIAGAL